MIVIDDKEIEIFAESMINTYNQNTQLKNISNLIEYSNKHYKHKFFQIGRRVLIPKEFFKIGNRLDNTPVATEFAQSVVSGEISFLVEHLTKKAKENDLKIVKINKFSYYEIVKIISENVNNPTDIFLPIDKCYDEVNQWKDNGRAFYKDGKLYVEINQFKIKVYWSNIYTSFNNILVTNRNNINIIQKKYDNMKVPKELSNIQYRFKSNEKLGLHFAESDDIDQFDFYFRSLIAIDLLDSKSASVIEISEI